MSWRIALYGRFLWELVVDIAAAFAWTAGAFPGQRGLTCSPTNTNPSASHPVGPALYLARAA